MDVSCVDGLHKRSEILGTAGLEQSIPGFQDRRRIDIEALENVTGKIHGCHCGRGDEGVIGDGASLLLSVFVS